MEAATSLHVSIPAGEISASAEHRGHYGDFLGGAHGPDVFVSEVVVELFVEVCTLELRLLECLAVAKFHQLSVVLEAHQHWPSFPHLQLCSRYYLLVVGGVILDGDLFLSLGIVAENGGHVEHVAFADAVILVQMVQLFSGQMLDST